MKGTPESELDEGLRNGVRTMSYFCVTDIFDVLSIPNFNVFLKQNGVESVEIVIRADGDCCVALLTALGTIENNYHHMVVNRRAVGTRRSNAASKPALTRKLGSIHLTAAN